MVKLQATCNLIRFAVNLEIIGMTTRMCVVLLKPFMSFYLSILRFYFRLVMILICLITRIKIFRRKLSCFISTKKKNLVKWTPIIFSWITFIDKFFLLDDFQLVNLFYSCDSFIRTNHTFFQEVKQLWLFSWMGKKLLIFSLTCVVNIVEWEKILI